MDTSVLVVVNASELEHLSYADPRRLLKDVGIDGVTLVTASDIARVRHEIDSPSTKALILASNSLRDVRLQRALHDELAPSVQAFLDRGGGVVCMHQLRLAESKDWLPPVLYGSELHLVPRPGSESGALGRAEATASGRDHPVLNFPIAVDLPLLNEQASSSGPRGLYWHSIELREQEKWSVLVRDEAPRGRPLLVERRFLPAGRLVFCSIQLDRIRDVQLFPNLVRYLRDGPYRIGLVRPADDESVAMDELQRTFSRRALAVYVHELGEPADPAAAAALRWGVSAGMHSSLVLAPRRHVKELPKEVESAVGEQVRCGLLRVLEMSDASGYGDDFAFTVVSRERDSITMLRSAVSRMRLAVTTGLADGSLWTTYEGLQCVENLTDGWSFVAADLTAAVTDANRRDNDGSYDETFVATGALAWLRSRACGPSDSSVRRSVSWLVTRRDREPVADGIRAATTLAAAGVLPKAWRTEVVATLDALATDLHSLSEIDVLACLNCSIALHEPTIEVYATALATRVHLGTWVELATTADCVSALVRALGKAPAVADPAQVRNAAMSGARYLRERLAGLGDLTTINSATHARVAAALYRYDEIVGVSVDALVDAAAGAAEQGLALDANDSYDELVTSARDSIRSYEDRFADLSDRYRNASRLAKWHRVIVAISCCAVYAAVALLIGVATARRPGLREAWNQALQNPEVHIAILLAMGGFLTEWIRRGWKSP